MKVPVPRYAMHRGKCASTRRGGAALASGATDALCSPGAAPRTAGTPRCGGNSSRNALPSAPGCAGAGPHPAGSPEETAAASGQPCVACVALQGEFAHAFLQAGVLLLKVSLLPGVLRYLKSLGRMGQELVPLLIVLGLAALMLVADLGHRLALQTSMVMIALVWVSHFLRCMVDLLSYQP
jgi:hypothetical protein